MVRDPRPPLPAAYDRYRREFDIPTSPVLDAFDEVVGRDHQIVEPSIKIDRGGGVNTGRFHVIFDRDLVTATREILRFLDRIRSLSGVSLNTSVLEKALWQLDFASVMQAACGLDVRSEPSQSRVKIWFEYLGQHAKTTSLLELHGYDDRILALVSEVGLAFGVDFTLSGDTRLKLYLKFTSDQLDNLAVRRRLESVLSPAAVALARRAMKLQVVFEPDLSTVVHLNLHQRNRGVADALDEDEVLALASDLPQCSALHHRCKRLGLDLRVITFNDADLALGRCNGVSLYYADLAALQLAPLTLGRIESSKS
jgi:LynF/TruF/PatF family peptide O-prenyltransferase